MAGGKTTRRTWVLDTETKGTGAQMVPLETVVGRRAHDTPPLPVPPKPRERPAPEPTPRPPRRFRVLDLMTRRTLAEDADARSTLAVLRDVRRSVDVQVSVWDPEAERWQPLSLAEQRALWDLRHRRASGAEADRAGDARPGEPPVDRLAQPARRS